MYVFLVVYMKSSLAYHRSLASSYHLSSTNSETIAALEVEYIAHNSAVITNPISLSIELELLIFGWMS